LTKSFYEREKYNSFAVRIRRIVFIHCESCLAGFFDRISRMARMGQIFVIFVLYPYYLSYPVKNLFEMLVP